MDGVLARGWGVVAVARDRKRLDELAALAPDRITPVPVDVFDEAGLRSALALAVLRAGVDDALLYLPGGDDLVENAAAVSLSTMVRGTTVRLLTSRWTPPAPGGLADGRWPLVPGRVHVLLGRRSEAPGLHWHSPEQISAAALEGLRSGEDAVLGRPVRP